MTVEGRAIMTIERIQYWASNTLGEKICKKKCSTGAGNPERDKTVVEGQNFSYF